MHDFFLRLENNIFNEKIESALKKKWYHWHGLYCAMCNRRMFISKIFINIYGAFKSYIVRCQQLFLMALTMLGTCLGKYKWIPVIISKYCWWDKIISSMITTICVSILFSLSLIFNKWFAENYWKMCIVEQTCRIPMTTIKKFSIEP